MIYLRPTGGLCNRMRTIDAFINISAEYRQNLTVIWNMDVTLNCSFYDLFELPQDNNFELRIIDCPKGFPEINLIKLGKKADNVYKIDCTEESGFLKGIAKSVILKTGLDEVQKNIAKKIGEIGYDNILTNEELKVVFDSSEYTNLTTREMDEVFLPKAAATYRKVLSYEGDFFISCCYRLSALVGAYRNFRPIENLLEKIEHVTQNFSKKTIGLHIRKSDHIIAKSISTTDKFIAAIEEALALNPDANFFLSTDDEHTKEELIRKYGASIITQEISGYSRNDPAAIQEALVDLYCLSKTSHILGSHHSSFSQTAADIGDIKEHTVK